MLYCVISVSVLCCVFLFGDEVMCDKTCYCVLWCVAVHYCLVAMLKCIVVCDVVTDMIRDAV